MLMFYFSLKIYCAKIICRNSKSYLPDAVTHTSVGVDAVLVLLHSLQLGFHIVEGAARRQSRQHQRCKKR